MDFSKYLSLGFSLTWLQDLVNQHGNEVLNVLDDLIEKGFSVSWVQELVALAGHLFFPTAKVACAAVQCKSLCPLSAAPGMVGSGIMGDGMMQFLLHSLTGMIGKNLSPDQQVLLNKAVDIILKLL